MYGMDQSNTQMCGFHRRQYRRGLVVSEGTGTFNDTSTLPPVQPASWSTTFFWHATSSCFDETNYQQLNTGVVEVKRMLASLIRKVEAERLAS